MFKNAETWWLERRFGYILTWWASSQLWRQDRTWVKVFSKQKCSSFGSDICRLNWRSRKKAKRNIWLDKFDAWIAQTSLITDSKLLKANAGLWLSNVWPLTWNGASFERNLTSRKWDRHAFKWLRSNNPCLIRRACS